MFDKNITPEFAAYVQRMMAKDPKDRPANMKDVMMELKTQKMFYNPPQPPARPTKRKQQQRRNNHRDTESTEKQ